MYRLCRHADDGHPGPGPPGPHEDDEARGYRAGGAAALQCQPPITSCPDRKARSCCSPKSRSDHVFSLQKATSSRLMTSDRHVSQVLNALRSVLWVLILYSLAEQTPQATSPPARVDRGSAVIFSLALCSSRYLCARPRRSAPTASLRRSTCQWGPRSRSPARSERLAAPRREGGMGAVRLGALLSRVIGKWSRAVASAVRQGSGSLSKSHIPETWPFRRVLSHV